MTEEETIFSTSKELDLLYVESGRFANLLVVGIDDAEGEVNTFIINEEQAFTLAHAINLWALETSKARKKEAVKLFDSLEVGDKVKVNNQVVSFIGEIAFKDCYCVRVANIENGIRLDCIIQKDKVAGTITKESN